MKGALALCALCVCVAAAQVVYPRGVPWTPPVDYVAIWQSAEGCSGRTASYDSIVWRIQEGGDFACREAGQEARCFGMWTWPDTILIASAMIHTWVPKHEMLHELVGPHYPGDSALWGRACHATQGYLRSEGEGNKTETQQNYRP